MKLSESDHVTYQSVCEKGTKPMEKKLELNRIYQFGEKSQKHPKNAVFQKSYISGGFWDFSPNW